MTRDELCEKAMRWLRGTRRCNPVYAHNASCSEIPDAIGWSSSHQWRGSTVIECKTSVSDFYADLRKYRMWQHPEHDLWRFPTKRISKKRAEQEGFKTIELLSMGDYRFYFCQTDVLSIELVADKAPDHGLIYVS